MLERYRRLLGLDDGVLSEYLFITFCTRYAQDNVARYQQLQQFIQLRNLVDSATASPPQQPIAAASEPIEASSQPLICPICEVVLNDDEEGSLFNHVRDVHSHPYQPPVSASPEPSTSSAAMTRFREFNSPSP